MSSAALEKLFIAELNTSDASLKPDLFSYESIFLNRIRSIHTSDLFTKLFSFFTFIYFSSKL